MSNRPSEPLIAFRLAHSLPGTSLAADIHIDISPWVRWNHIITVLMRSNTFELSVAAVICRASQGNRRIVLR
jgi:hypothetical protein